MENGTVRPWSEGFWQRGLRLSQMGAGAWQTHDICQPPPPSFLPSLIGSNPRDTWFCYWSVAWPSSSSYPSCSYYSCGQRGLFSSPLLPPPHPTVKKSKLCSFLISYIFLNLSDSEVVPWVCSQWKFLLCLALEVWPLPGKQHISWFIEWSIWIWA